jgi:hypothetical protein
MKRHDISNFLFYAISVVVVLGLFFVFGLYSGAHRTFVYEFVDGVKVKIVESFNITIEESPNLLGLYPKDFVQPARYEGEGVTINRAQNGQDDLILLVGFFEDSNGLRLIRRDGTVIASWPVRFSEIISNPEKFLGGEVPTTDWNIDVHGALALPDGSVVFNFEYGGLVKLDRCGNVVWTLAQRTHHSVEVAEGGGFWVPGRRYLPQAGTLPFPPFETPMQEDTLLRVSEDGAVIAEISVPQLFFDNGLEAILTATGYNFRQGMQWGREVVHLNKIDELSEGLADDFPMFDAGDLALSLREQNMVLVVDPDSGEIKWWKIGPWVRQHDPEFRKGGTIAVFNNNIYRSAFKNGSQISDPSIPRVSNILEVNPETNEHRIIYGHEKGQEFLSVLRGNHEPTQGGGFLITEFEGGRIFETDSQGRVIWEYINRYDDDEVLEVTGARMYSQSYFDVADWRCENRDP